MTQMNMGMDDGADDEMTEGAPADGEMVTIKIPKEKMGAIMDALGVLMDAVNEVEAGMGADEETSEVAQPGDVANAAKEKDIASLTSEIAGMRR